MGKIKYLDNGCMQKAAVTYACTKIGSNKCGDMTYNISDEEVIKVLEEVKDLEITKEHIRIDYYVINFDEGVKITSLCDLSKFTNLTSLKIIGQKLENLDDMPKLDNLHTLCLSENGIKDISNIKGANIKVLYLNNNSIEDISILSNLKECEVLNIANNKITDISALSNLKYLVRLQLENNKIKNIESLSGLEELCSLNLSNNKICDIKPLRTLEKMLYLYIQNNNISSIEDLCKLTELIEFNWQGNNIIEPYNNEVDFYNIQELSNKIDKKRWRLVLNKNEQEFYRNFFEEKILKMHPLYKVKIVPVAKYIDENRHEDENFILAAVSNNRIIIINIAHCVSVDGETVGYPSYRMFLRLDEALEYLREESYCI